MESVMSVTSIRRVTAALATFALLCLVDPVLAAEPEPFEVMGIVDITNVEGDTLQADVSGESAPGGEFVGTLCERLVGFGTGAVGTVTYEFDNGSLTIYFVDVVLPDGSIEGGWNVVKGTGVFAGANGGGELTGFFVDDSSAVFELTGTIVR